MCLVAALTGRVVLLQLVERWKLRDGMTTGAGRDARRRGRLVRLVAALAAPVLAAELRALVGVTTLAELGRPRTRVRVVAGGASRVSSMHGLALLVTLRAGELRA